jgi:hypothetical protein
MTTEPKTRKAAGKIAATDPIFAAIAEHKAREREWMRLGCKLGDAEDEASTKYGDRPSSLIAWRNYSAMGGPRIDDRRELFLSQPGADRKQIEKEYRDAKEREAAAVRAGAEWDQRNGLTPLREQAEHAKSAENKAAMRLARTKPTTPAGAGALVAYTLRDIKDHLPTIWSKAALKTVSASLARMKAR